MPRRGRGGECPGATHFLTLNDELVTRFDARTDAILVLRIERLSGADQLPVQHSP